MPRSIRRTSPWRRCLMVAVAVLAASASGHACAQPGAEAVDAIARRYQMAGEMLVARGDRILLDRGYGTIAPSGGVRHKAGERWRLASITKQMIAALIVKSVGVDALDRPISAPQDRALIGTLTLRQLLTHHTGLANPDATPATADGMPSFYTAREPDIDYCLSVRPRPGAPFAYNNCDYILASFMLEVARGGAIDLPGVRWAKANEVGVPGFVGGKPEPRFQLASFGAAGGLLGTARAVFDFDRALMTGKLLTAVQRTELWKPEGGGSYQALGQWVFPGGLRGCATPKRIVQRDGEIQGVQTRNFILPDDDLVVIVFTNRSADDFALGEVWEGKGFVYDLLSAAACS